MSDAQQNHFESFTDRYYNARQKPNHLFYKELLWKYFFNEISKLCNFNGCIDVCEPMCGYAEGKTIIEKYFYAPINYEGFDISDNLLEKARKKNIGINIYKADVRTYIPSKKYDVIIIIGALHHVFKDVNSILFNIRRAIKENGIFINFEPTNNFYFIGKIRNIIYRYNSFFDYQTEKGFNLSYLNSAYKKSGFSILKQIYTGLLSYIMFYNPDAFPWLDLGGKTLVKSFFNLDKLFIKNKIGKLFSFATLTALKPL
jgi:SAM-dependent methyltransferase